MSGGTRFEARKARYDRNVAALEGTMVRSERGDRLAAATLLRQPAVRLEALVNQAAVVLDLDEATPGQDIASLENDVKYAGYLKQERARAERTQARRTASDSRGFPVRAGSGTLARSRPAAGASATGDARPGLTHPRRHAGGRRRSRRVSRPAA